MSYTFKDFDAQFPDDAACLQHIFRARYAGHVCECGKSNCFYRVSKRRCYACSFCGAQLHPTAGTIFHKSETSLKSWFFAIFLFAKSKNGVAAAELARQVGVTYKTAFRMTHKIRELMASGGNMLTGVCEETKTIIGGRRESIKTRMSEMFEVRSEFTSKWLSLSETVSKAIVGGYPVLVQINGEFYDVRKTQSH